MSREKLPKAHIFSQFSLLIVRHLPLRPNDDQCITIHNTLEFLS